MESSSSVSRYIPQKSKNRVFPGGSSSSSSGCKEVEILEIPSPVINATSSSRNRSSKDKEVIYHDVIDVDMDEDDGDGKIDTRAKGKEALSSFPVGHSSVANDGSGIDIQISNNFGVDDFSSNPFYEEDAWMDTYYDDIVYDDYAVDYAVMESRFDHMDIPPGVEAPFPWLPSSPRNNNNLVATSTSTNSGSHLHSASANFSPITKSSQSSWPLEIGQTKDKSTSWNNSTVDHLTDKHYLKGEQPSKTLEHGPDQKKSTTSSSTYGLRSQHSKGSSVRNPLMEAFYTFGKSKRSHASMAYTGLNNQFHSGYLSSVYSGSRKVSKRKKAIEGMAYMPMWEDLPMNMMGPSMGSPEFMNGSAFGYPPTAANNQSSGPPMTSAPSTVEPKNMDEILQKFDAFKKFDTVEDYSDHHYSKKGSSAKQPPKNWAKRIQEEWKILEKDLPDTIFVRVYESRMDLLRAVIVGAEGTPYHDGLFFFDVCFPSSYPNVPPQVHYHSGGLRINPNLYNCGKVCLSLLNTWTGSQKEKWNPGVSTMLQVLVSIQGLILNAKPYFNEPGYASMNGSKSGEKSSLEYNERTFMYSLQTMVYNIRRPPKHFGDFVVGHFCKHARDILVSCKAYLEGAQVGCLVKGGVQDVDEGDKSCSQNFKNNLAGFVTTIVNAFSQIGAKDCAEFLSLAQKGNGAPTASFRQNYLHHY